MTLKYSQRPNVALNGSKAICGAFYKGHALDKHGIVTAFMRHFVDWTFHSLIDHPYQTAFYILAILVSIFGRDIRAFLSIPPQRLNIWILKSRLASAKSTLVALQNCHHNTYQLVLFVSSGFSAGIVFSLFATIAAFLRPFAPSTAGDLWLTLLIFTMYLIPLTIFWSIASFIKQLWHYEAETKTLERRIIQLIDRLAAKGIDSNALLKSIEESQRAK